MKCLNKKNKELLSEYQIQEMCIKWIRAVHPGYLCWSCPNEAAGTRASKYKRIGLLAGASDLILVKPNRVVFIEMKKLSGRQSKEQRTFQSNIEYLGFEYYICRSLDEFKKIVEN